MQNSAEITDRPAQAWASRTILFAAALVGLLLVWMPASYSMVRRWMGTQGYYSHGLLIPLISVYLIWMRREELKRAPIRRSGWGLLPLAVGALGQFASAYTEVAFSSGFSVILILVGLVWFVYGPAVFRLVAFPLCFLGFMVPLYMELLEQASFPMKRGAAAASTWLMRDVLGVPCARVGSSIGFADAQLAVGDPCSGLRSLIALMALGALVAYLARMSLWRRVVLFLCSIPFALAANVVRITVLGLVANRWGEKATKADLVHYGTGFLVFFVAVVLLVGLYRLLRVGTPAPPRERPAPWPEPLRRAAQVLLVLAVAKALVTMFALEGVAARYVTAEHLAAVRGIPAADLPPDALSDHLGQIRLERFARGTIDVNYVFFTLVGLVFLVRGLRWARVYLQGLAILGIAAEVGFVVWLLRVEKIAVPAASLGLKPFLVSLHLVLYAGLSAVSLLWTLGRLSHRGLRTAVGAGVPAEEGGRGFAARASAGVVVTAALAALTWWLVRPVPVEAGVIRARNVPHRIGPWVGQDFETEDVVIETLETRDILTRVYRCEESPVAIQLSVVFSQHNRRATHPPEICLRGTGWETDHRARITLDVPRGADRPSTPFVELVSKAGGQARLVTFYTFKAGRSYTNGYFQQQWDVFMMNLAGRAARGALVRFSASTTPEDLPATRETLIDFMRLALPLIERELEGDAREGP